MVADENQADAVLKGAVVNYLFFPNVVDQDTGRAAGVQVLVVLQLSLYERATGKVIYTQPSMEVRNRYEIAIDPHKLISKRAISRWNALAGTWRGQLSVRYWKPSDDARRISAIHRKA